MNIRRTSALIGLASCVAVLASCAGSEATSPSPTTHRTSASPPIESASTDTASTGVVPAAPIAPEHQAPIALANSTTIELLGPEAQDVGPTPMMSWAEVADATSYRLVVRTDGGVVWAWEGAESSVRLGGLDEAPPDGLDAVRLDEPSWWSVTAWDDVGNLVGTSPLRGVSPDGRPAPATPPLPVVTAAPAVQPTPDTATSSHPCALLSIEEVTVALGSAPVAAEPSEGRNGAFRNCTWISSADEYIEIQLSITDDPTAFDPDGWTQGEIVPIDGLGEQSFISTDFGWRIGWLRDDRSVALVALGGVGTDQSWKDLARLVDSRLVDAGLVP